MKVSFTKANRFGESFIQFRDNEGLHLELVEREGGPLNKWTAGGVPTDKAIKGFGGAVLYSADSKHTQGVLENVLGMTLIGEDANAGYIRYQTTGDLGNLIDIPVKDVPWGMAVPVRFTILPGARRMIRSIKRGTNGFTSRVLGLVAL